MNSTKLSKGFTLIELLVVIAIIGLLSSIVLTVVEGARVDARDAKRQGDLLAVRNALEIYRTTVGSYPSTGNGWWGMCTNFNGGFTTSGASGYIPNLAPKYIPVLPVDPKPLGAGTYGANGCYLYNSNGIDYIFLIYLTVEGPQIPSLLRVSNPGEKDYAVYSDGAKNW